jgi:hypothetical protein
MTTLCAHCGRRPAKGDEFCSVRCARLASELPIEERYRGYIEVENPHVSRAHHDGPAIITSKVARPSQRRKG